MHLVDQILVRLIHLFADLGQARLTENIGGRVPFLRAHIRIVAAFKRVKMLLLLQFIKANCKSLDSIKEGLRNGINQCFE